MKMLHTSNSYVLLTAATALFWNLDAIAKDATEPTPT
jgi:hypothetical protein